MMIHPREERCRAAEGAINEALWCAVDKYALTDAERLRVVTAALAGYLSGMAKYAIREERHGNSNTPGGLA